MADRVSAGAAARSGAQRPRTAPGGHGESAWAHSERVTRGGGHDDRNVERRRAGLVHARAPRRNHRQGDAPREEGGRAMGEGATRMNQTDTGNGKVQARSPRETTRQLDGEIAALREELAGLVGELDRRRHELLDIKLQAKRHALEMVLTGTALVATAAGFVWLGAWRSRRRQSMRSRAGRLREAFSRMLAKPERVAAEP